MFVFLLFIKPAARTADQFILRELCPSVNFTNILWAPLLYKSYMCSFFVLEAWLHTAQENLWKKMLLKCWWNWEVGCQNNHTVKLVLTTTCQLGSKRLFKLFWKFIGKIRNVLSVSFFSFIWTVVIHFFWWRHDIFPCHVTWFGPTLRTYLN